MKNRYTKYQWKRHLDLFYPFLLPLLFLSIFSSLLLRSISFLEVEEERKRSRLRFRVFHVSFTPRPQKIKKSRPRVCEENKTMKNPKDKIRIIPKGHKTLKAKRK